MALAPDVAASTDPAAVVVAGSQIQTVRGSELQIEEGAGRRQRAVLELRLPAPIVVDLFEKIERETRSDVAGLNKDELPVDLPFRV